jgi:hypothetical protein
MVADTWHEFWHSEFHLLINEPLGNFLKNWHHANMAQPSYIISTSSFISASDTQHWHSWIQQTKTDCKAAYKHLHFDPKISVQAIALMGPFLLMALRMTFGGAPNPSQWSDMSKLATDLANDLVCDGGWDHTTQKSPHQHIQNEAVWWEQDNV